MSLTTIEMGKLKHTERHSYLPKVTQLVTGRGRIPSQVSWIQSWQVVSTMGTCLYDRMMIVQTPESFSD